MFVPRLEAVCVIVLRHCLPPLGVGQRHAGMRPQNSSLCAPRHRYLSVGPRQLEGIGVEEIMKSEKRYTRATRELVSVLVHAQRHSTHHAAHTIETAS